MWLDRNSLICYFLFCFGVSAAKAQDIPPSITATGEQYYCASAPMFIANNVAITDPDASDTELDEVFIQISEGYDQGRDVLVLTGNHPNISANWSVAEGSLTLMGPATLSEFSLAIESVTFETSAINFQSDKLFSINLGSANYLPSTGHYYFYVEDFGVSWETAKTAAENLNYFGLQGYLATLTLAEEAVLAGEQSAGTGWIGGSDSEQEGVWKWMTGPEAGQVFWNGLSNGSAPNGAFAFWNTGEPNNCCGGEDYAHVTDPSTGILGSWNDLPVGGDANLDPSNPYTPKGYVVEFGGMPGDPEVNLSASTKIITPQYTIANGEQCGPGEAEFSIVTNTEQILWYDSETSTNLLSSDIDYRPYLNQTTTFYIIPVFSGCTDGPRVPITVEVQSPPIANDITIIQCNDGPDLDGVSIFNLNLYIDELTGSVANRTVRFYDDDALNNQIDGAAYINNFNFQTVFAVVTDSQTTCSSLADITLVVGENNPNTVLFENCDDADEDGRTSFDLSMIESEVLSGSPSGLGVSYYLTYSDALTSQNEISNNFTNTIPYNQTILAKLSQDNICYGIREVNLQVLELPKIGPDQELYYCLNDFPATISLVANSQASGSLDYAYSWSTGSTSRQININEAGTYTVTAITAKGCQKTKTFTVLPSEIATITGIEVNDLNQNNSVTISVSGSGSYQYAIESVAGPYQDSNSFENLSAGFYTVYVRDVKNDCGIAAQRISVVGYPKFFTPNGDGFNDTWSLRGVSNQFQPNSRVLIYNRYGGIVKMLNSATDAWDGTFNGALQPSSDYWFSGLLQDGRTFKGHFSLKR